MANGYLVAKSGCVYKHNQRDQGETEMAEGLLGGILGGEDEEKAASTEAGPEALVAAVATNIANHSPEVAAKTATFFEEQTEPHGWAQALPLYKEAVRIKPDYWVG